MPDGGNGRFGKSQPLSSLDDQAAKRRPVAKDAAFFEPGERTGKFHLGKNDLIADASGKSHISLEDYAIATVDELEAPAHHRERFTIGY